MQGPDREVARATSGDLKKRVAGFLSRYNMAADAHIGVAVSGGSDSIALLHLLHTLAPPLKLTVLHFNHKLRGAESDADETFVREQAAQLGLAIVVEHSAQHTVNNLEATARTERLDFFHRARMQLGLAAVATGHTEDDQAETVLFRLLRGSGTTGLAGILPTTREGLIRPLLDCTREDLRIWLRAREIPWREDRTNFDPDFARRNRLRMDLLPQLRREWNPNLTAALAHSAAIANDEEEYWRGECQNHLPPDGTFNMRQFLALPTAFQRRLIRAAIAQAQGHLHQIGFAHIESVLKLFHRPSGDGRVPLPGGLCAERSFSQIRIGPPPRKNVEGVTYRQHPSDQPANRAYNRGRKYRLDISKIGVDLELRPWARGDRFQPAGSADPKKMKHLFQEAHIPSWHRAAWPMLVSGETVVWTRFFGTAQGFEAAANAAVFWEVCDADETYAKLESKAQPSASMFVAGV